MARKPEKLLYGFLERVSWRVLEQYPGIIADLIHRRAGVYALYKQDRLYYVGLASNLMRRLKSHLRDRHAGLWDRFSVYITTQNDHIKQLESLLLRIAKPPGNRVKGNFGGPANFYRRLNRAMSAADADRRAAVLGGHAVRQRRRRKMKGVKGTLVWAGLVERRPLRAVFKGKTYKASLRRDGYISYAGTLYDSPSAAAKRVVKRATNGWTFWYYREGPKTWKPLAHLRK